MSDKVLEHLSGPDRQNRIKRMLKRGVGAPNTGTGTGTMTRTQILSKIGVLPLANLPEASLSPDQFEDLPDGSIGIKTSYLQSLGLGGGTAPVNTTPATPTLTADDTANTLSAAHALGTSEIVMSENGGAYIPYTLISVGNITRPAGYWKFKVKSAAGRNESAVVNSPAFTVAQAASGLAPITEWAVVENGVASNSNSFDFTTPPGQFGFAYSDKKIAEGTSGYVQFDAILPVAPNDVTAALSLAATPRAVHSHDQGINAWYSISNKIVSRIEGVWNDSAWTQAGAGTKIRIRVDGATAYVESSINNGVDWVIIRSGDRPAGDLYVRVFADVSKTNLLINNIQGSGLV